ncbi:macrophage mannose receptor 1-like [Salminus brasiliensis]|uniref:macrophage mannose receptor 1-like n=1 Tax=Salminus brasiliensis TaxID=930266 RepID=UPI003B834899
MTWTEAQTYCRQIYTDLATIESTNDSKSLIAAVNGSYNGLSWIGLYDDVENGWKWYFDDDAFYGPGERDYRNWRKTKSTEPNNYLGNEMCTEMESGIWNDLPCSSKLYFICYNKTSNRYVLISSSKNISDARQHCRQYHTDLASIRNATENQLILSISSGNTVWLGLYRNRQWSDKSNSTYENWSTGQPDNMNSIEHCTAASLSNSGQWTDENCNRTLPFFCYKASPRS